MPFRFILFLLLALSPLPAGAAEKGPWHVFYEERFRLAPTGTWLGAQTRSERTPEGLRVVDPSTEKESGRLYFHAWQVDPKQGASVEVRLKAVAASAPWGACVNVADGVHEEDVSFFPDRVMLSYANLSAGFPAGDGFHTYRITFRGEEIRVWADDRLLLDGKGRFTHPVISPARNRLAFGASSSTATSESVWQRVRFQGGRVDLPRISAPRVPGLSVRREETVVIQPGASYANMFRFAQGMLQVGGRRSTDGGRTWADAGGPWVGACPLPDGEVVALDYRTHRDAGRDGWYTSALRRWSADGRPLPEERAALHVPEFVDTVDDDGSRRDGPWCDHSILALRDGSLLAACSGCFGVDTTPIPSYHPEWGAKKYRGFVCRSTDRGRTWEYLATVTADPTLGAEGCNEMDLVRTPKGDLLCLFRTGGSAEKPWPLFQCRSRDEGRTWGRPQRVADRGVWPNACVLESGVIVCPYGRPGNWLAFSLDDGHTWVGHTCFYNGPTTAYNSVEEVSPGRILVMYDQSEIDEGGHPRSGVMGTFFSVRR